MMKKDNPTLLILGCGSCQLEAIERTRGMGFRTAVASNDPDCPGRRAADAFLEVSTFDVEGIRRAAEEIQADGILPVGTDQPVFVAARVSEKLGLPSFISSETALNVTNKKRMKSLLSARGIPVNPYRICSPDDLGAAAADLRPPYVVKPVDSQGQRGVYLAESREEASARARETLSFSREQELCIEEYYPSGEITASCWARNGEVYLLSATDRSSFYDPPYIGICNAHLFPSRYLPGFSEKIYDLCRRSAEACGITDGPVYVQLLNGEEGLRVNEIAARIGGAYEDVFIPRIEGFDILEANLAGVLGDTAEPPARRIFAFPPKTYIASQLFYLRPGGVRQVTPAKDILGLPGVVKAFTAVRPGDVSGPVVSSSQRAGFIVIEGESRSRLNSRITEVYDRFRIEDVSGEQLILPFPRISGAD